MATAGSVVVNLIANTGRFTRGMKTSRKSMYSLQRQAMATRAAIAKFTAGLAAAGGVYYSLKKFVTAASDAQETMNKFNVVFGEHARVMRKWSTDFADSMGRSRKEVAKWLSGLQDTFVPLGYSRDRAKELSKQLTQLAVDVGSFNNIADDTVIRDFTSALVGNHEAVRKYGIIITETSMKQRAMMEGLDPKHLTNMQKVQLRYNAILESTADAQGDAARTADAYANQAKRLEANIDNLQVAIGSHLVPVFNILVQEINNSITGFANLGNSIMDSQAVMIGYKAAIYETLAGLMEIADVVNQLNPAYKLEQSFGINTWVGMDYAALRKKYLNESKKLWKEADRAADKEISSRITPPVTSRITPPVTSRTEAATPEPVIEKLKNKDTFSFAPGARSIDTSNISVEGLAMQGNEYAYEKQQVSLLEEISRNTRKTANQESLN